MRAARRQAVTRTFQQRYRRWRPMVERSLAWLVADGCRRAPYRGIDRNDLWWSLRVAAVNLRRLLVLGLARRAAALGAGLTGWQLPGPTAPARPRTSRPATTIGDRVNDQPVWISKLQQVPRRWSICTWGGHGFGSAAFPSVPRAGPSEVPSGYVRGMKQGTARDNSGAQRTVVLWP